MAVTRGTLQIARRLRRDIGTEVDQVARNLTSAWVKEWDQLAPGWQLAAADMVAEAGRLEHWPRPTDIARLDRVMAALDASERALTALAHRTREDATSGAERVIDADVELEARIIASQAPTTEREGLLRHLTGRMPVAEQDRDTVRLTVQTRIRTDAVNVVRRRAAGQITADTVPLAPAAVDSMRRELIRGIDVGSNPREAAARMVARVEGQFNGGLDRAMVISRTEVLDAYRTTSQQIHAANSDIVPAWSWLATWDLRVCPSCISLHGTVYPVSEPGPQDHQQGRCARLPQLAPWAELGITAPEPPSAIGNAQAWFDNLPEATQLQIMGPARLALYRDGHVGWGDLSTTRQSPGWRPSRVPTPVRDLRQRADRGLRPTPRPVPTRPAAPRPRITTPTLPAPAPPPRWSPPPTMSPQQAQTMQAARPALTAAEEGALRQYTAGGAADMNDLLRGVRQAGPEHSLVQADIRAANQAMAALPQDVLLYRYVGADAFGVANVDELPGLVGRRLQEPGFMSTSVARSGYRDPFGQMEMATGRPVLMEIAASRGTRAVYVDGVSRHPGQYEMVLAPGTTYEVVEVVQQGAHTVVRVRVVP